MINALETVSLVKKLNEVEKKLTKEEREYIANYFYQLWKEYEKSKWSDFNLKRIERWKKLTKQRKSSWCNKCDPVICRCPEKLAQDILESKFCRIVKLKEEK